MTKLTEAEFQALRYLADQAEGKPTPFLNIAAAQSLTGMGLASRNRQGWEITAEGSALISHLGGPSDNDESTP
jgi:hypothetical protein